MPATLMQTTPATRSTAGDIVREIEYRDARRRWRRNGAIAGGVVGVVLLAMLFVRLGRGAGASGAAARPRVLISPDGITVDGAVASIEATIAACRGAGACDVTVTGDTREGDWQALLAALRSSGVPFTVRG